MTALTRVCALEDIDDPGAKEFEFDVETDHVRGFVVRRGANVFAYINCCPHAGAMLNWGPGKFLTRDGSLIMCSVHGANFLPTTGLCVAGPCKGRSLQSMQVDVIDNQVMVGR